MCEKCDAIRAAAEAAGGNGYEALTRAAQKGIVNAMTVEARVMVFGSKNRDGSEGPDMRLVSEDDFMEVVENLQKVGKMAVQMLDELYKTNELFALQADVTGDLAVLISEQGPAAMIQPMNAIRDRLQSEGATIRAKHEEFAKVRDAAMAKDEAENESRDSNGQTPEEAAGLPSRGEIQAIAEKLLADMPPEIKEMLKSLSKDMMAKRHPGNGTKH